MYDRLKQNTYYKKKYAYGSDSRQYCIYLYMKIYINGKTII